MKLILLTLMFLLNATLALSAPSRDTWFSSEGVHKTKLFADSLIAEDPIVMTVIVDDWQNVHTNPTRAEAHSEAQFIFGDLTVSGSIQARGVSRFNLFRIRALTFLMGNDDLKVVNRNGGFKTQPEELSNSDQDARVLVEYLIYKIHELLFKEESVKTRLALITYQDRNGKNLDKGYGFFLEGKGQVGKRLNLVESRSWDFPHDSEPAIAGNIFRALILDGDIDNMINNFIYLADKNDSHLMKRVAYDFDYSALAPPQPIGVENIPTLVSTYRAWLEKSYQLGATSSHDYPAVRKGTKRQQEKALADYRIQIVINAQKISDQSEIILKSIPWKLLPGAYQLSVKNWFAAALNETNKFVQAHKMP